MVWLLIALALAFCVIALGIRAATEIERGENERAEFYRAIYRDE
jgi:hypothetical protein